MNWGILASRKTRQNAYARKKIGLLREKRRRTGGKPLPYPPPLVLPWQKEHWGGGEGGHELVEVRIASRRKGLSKGEPYFSRPLVRSGLPKQVGRGGQKCLRARHFQDGRGKRKGAGSRDASTSSRIPNPTSPPRSEVLGEVYHERRGAKALVL